MRFGSKRYDPSKTFKIYLVGISEMKFAWKNHFIDTEIKVSKLTSEIHTWKTSVITKSSKFVDICKAICKFVMIGEYRNVSWASCERDNLEGTISSLLYGISRAIRVEEVFGFGKDDDERSIVTGNLKKEYNCCI